MSITKAEIASYVREYWDTDADEITDALVEVWTVEGWRRIQQKTRRWPKLYGSTTVNVTTGTQVYAKPLRDIVRVEHADRIGLLSFIAPEHAAVRWPPPVPTGEPSHWSVDGDFFEVWPKPDAAYTLTVAGYRALATPKGIGTAAVIDLPDDGAEDVLRKWVEYRAAEHQDEDHRAAAYRQEFEVGLRALHQDQLTSPLAPLTLRSESGTQSPIPPRLRFDFE